jgi:PAS domain S-box-containing protein
MLMHPYQPDLIGKDLSDEEDFDGTKIFLLFNQMIQQNGEGFLEYNWQLREDQSQYGRKLSYVKLYEPWGWVIGNGLYLDDLNKTLTIIRRGTYGVIVLLLVFIGIWSTFTIWRTQQVEKKRQAALFALASSEAQLSTLFDSAFQFIALLDLQGRVVKVNQTALSFINRSAQDIIGLYFWETDWFHVDPALMSSIKDCVERCAKGEFVRMEIENYGHLDKQIYMDSSFKPILSTNQVVNAILVEGRDITQRKIAEQEIKKQLIQLDALHQIDLAINSGSGLLEVIKVIFDQIERLYPFDGLSFWRYEQESHQLINLLDRGFKKSWKETRLEMGEGFAGQVALDKNVLYRSDRDWLSQPDMKFVRMEGFVDFAGFPLISHGELVGVLEVFQRAEINMEANDWQFLDAIAGQAAIALDNAALLTNLQRTNIKLSQSYDLTLEGWAKALELRDEETEDHSRRLINMTLQLCQRMGLEEEALLHVRRGAILHDVGKMGIPDGILLKAGPLTPEEWKVMKAHPVYAFNLLSPIPFLKEALDIPYCHHEWWNGLGYPRGLKGEQIPLAARVFSVIDVWDALSHDRPYRKAWDEEKVKNHILHLSGTQFDPQVVEQFMVLLKGYEKK